MQKLFNVLVPRYTQTTESYTAQHQLPNKYPENTYKSVLELKGNINMCLLFVILQFQQTFSHLEYKILGRMDGAQD